eukprot:Gb_36000 [translate_table: standard]
MKQHILSLIGPKCTTFEVLSAYMWWSRMWALNLPADQEVRQIFPLDAEDITLCYGNAISMTCAKARAGDVGNRPLSYATKLIHEAKKMVGDEYM